ncbi:hypothetical protein CB1_000958003 [Camelus ferus]|nr:hypothetical protein CB1_000958003 [Camelus ferus]
MCNRAPALLTLLLQQGGARLFGEIMGNGLAQVLRMGLERSSRSTGMFGGACQVAEMPPSEEEPFGGLLAAPYLWAGETAWGKQMTVPNTFVHLKLCRISTPTLEAQRGTWALCWVGPAVYPMFSWPGCFPCPRGFGKIGQGDSLFCALAWASDPQKSPHFLGPGGDSPGGTPCVKGSGHPTRQPLHRITRGLSEHPKAVLVFRMPSARAGGDRGPISSQSLRWQPFRLDPAPGKVEGSLFPPPVQFK